MAKKQTVTMTELLERLEDYNMAMIICDRVAKARFTDKKPIGKIQWGKFKDMMHIVADFRDVSDTDLVDTDM